MNGQTLYDKLWQNHLVQQRELTLWLQPGACAMGAGRLRSSKEEQADE
jgi:hypothetical protein